MSRSERRRAPGALALVAALIALAAGCSSDKITVAVDSTVETNGGRPFYAVVRAVEQATFVTDGYDSIASKVFQNPPDPSVLRSEVVYPGTTLKIKVTKPDVLPVAVYLLFNEPGERWKASFAQPLSNISLECEKNSLKKD